MQKLRFIVLPVLFGALNGALVAQVPAKNSGDASQIARHSAELAESGHCAEALATLKSVVRKIPDRDLKRRVALDGVRCAMGLNQTDDALDLLHILTRDFKRDPDVLYLSIHTYSDLATRASTDLATYAPSSYQARELNAEAYEMQGKWDKAAAEYQKVLKQNPEVPGVHFRLGRHLLSEPNPPPDVVEQARHEFEQELKIDPSNAGAEYVLGELARRNQQWDDAANHFSRASKLDAGFGDAFLGLGESLISSRKFSEAIPALQTAVKLEPTNPAAHYNLATAYSRAGRKADADKEFAIHRQMTQKGDAAQEAPQGNPPDNPN
jgi:tetratricopeptide (TPR) repeat protein